MIISFNMPYVLRGPILGTKNDDDIQTVLFYFAFL